MAVGETESEMEGVDVREVLSKEEKRLFGAAVCAVFLSFQLSG